MGELNGRVAVITGAGRGLGREHALLFAGEGALLVVNDLGGAADGTGADQGPADAVVDEIRAAGGEAIANHDDVADWGGAESLIRTAVDTYGDLHVLVNNAGILRDRSVANMSVGEWDAVIRVHLRGHFCPTRFAAEWWRDRAKSGDVADRALINTSSTSGLLGNFGQTNYGAAKAGIAAFTIISQLELGRYGVRANAIAPAARTRLTAPDGGAAPARGFDDGDPANVSPLVAYLATDGCPHRGQVFFVWGRQVRLMHPWTLGERIDSNERWTIAGLREAAAPLADIGFPTAADVFGRPD